MMALGPVPAEMFPSEVSAPVPWLIAYMVTSFEPWLAVYANLPEGSTATVTGVDPAATLPFAERTPVTALIVYIETLFDVMFGT